MTAPFDAYETSYEQLVQRSIAFSGLEHTFFINAKLGALAELFAHHFGAKKPDLLDVGCGIGRMHFGLQPIVRSLAGCDISSKALERATREHPRAEYRVQIGETIPWASNTFDVTLAVCVFHHVAVLKRALLLNEMHRITRPGGLVVIIEHNPWNPATRLSVARCPFDHDAVLLGSRQTLALMARIGLARVHSRHILLLPSAAHWAKWIESRVRHIPLGAQYLAIGHA
jgi:SAM-dependent methyltransferase